MVGKKSSGKDNERTGARIGELKVEQLHLKDFPHYLG